MCEVCSKITIKTLERPNRSSVFVVNFERISYFFLVFLLLTLSMHLFCGFFNLKIGVGVPYEG